MILRCSKCQVEKGSHLFSIDKQICGDCAYKHMQSNQSEYCEPCAVLDSALVDASEKIDETNVCNRCANAVRFMKQRQAEEIQINICLGRVPF